MTEQADAGMDTPKSLREYITNTVINTVPPLNGTNARWRPTTSPAWTTKLPIAI